MSNIPLLRYDPHKEGLRRWLGPTEAIVMDVLWHERKPLDVGAVVQRIADDEGDARNYRTIATILTRLAGPKPLLYRRSVPAALGGGHDCWIYWPVCTIEEFEARQAEAIVKSLGVLV